MVEQTIWPLSSESINLNLFLYMITASMIIELLIVLLALYVGSRYGSLALGAISGIGLAILVFGFGLKPGTPPTDVIYIIIAAVT